MQKEVIQDITENYKDIESSIVKQLNLKVNNHQLTAGYNREKIWLELFRQIIPMKFAIRQGVFLIDSKGNVSKEVDIAVFDEQFTPYIFNYRNIHFIPIEAVSVVVQCKSKTIKAKEVNEWYKKIDDLQTVTGGIARMATFIATDSPETQKATKPISILCHMKNKKYNNENYDLILCASDEKITVNWNDKVNTLEKAYKRFNGITDMSKIKVDSEEGTQKLKSSLDDLSVKDNSILSLIFQLNQLLMLINNPMLFPHQAYVDMFNVIK
ncbi:MAG: hypothetical protein JJE17_03135 [Peptostreptococcaceae bacterium]|nr:hypothetical protein [Peptostreptococcaceae bacterium]